ncbi:glycoside hydrolase family 43 protein [Desertivirga xinjiangensis]|uniref:glycoside hydrolase family 43 protein n=1 Tax=Desertivirga xinjiangensis TaxID=539206 RepID=UPI002109152A|nr:glycoside hydrolase family 43 protein [Pedobacter xinjiangensis]
MKEISYLLFATALIFTCCESKALNRTAGLNPVDSAKISGPDLFKGAISEPLIPGIFTADPSVHVFEGKLFIYPSHDIDAGTTENDNGDHFAMKDYHVFSMDEVGGVVKDHGIALDVQDIPWAGRQLWAPDVAFRNGKYYLYFPLKDKNDIFRIGVAISDKPQGPFKAQPEPIKGSFSIDPAAFTDNDGSSYLYFGGIWGGQLQQWENGEFNAKGSKFEGPQDQPALAPKIAKLKPNMLQFAEVPKDIIILDENGKIIQGGDHDKRFFEAAWVHKYKDKYYFSYSTGDTHLICYATGSSPYGPFTYQGIILNPVVGWTTHHSIVEFKEKWYLFYHDTQLSNGKTHLRNVKVTELKYDNEGKIITIDPYSSK